MAMLLITHDLGIVRHMAERVCVMQGGKIVEAGTTADGFRSSAAPLYAPAAGGRAQGHAAGVPTRSAATVLEARGSQSLVSDQARLLPADGRPHQGGRRRRYRGRAKDRRSAWWANRARARPRSASRSCGSSQSEGPIVYLGRRHRRLRRGRRCGRCASEMQIVFQDPYGSLSARGCRSGRSSRKG